MFTEKQHPPNMNSQQEQQVEKLKELGAQIRQVREEQSVSIDEIATRTRIQARLLVAIEEGQLENLPEPVYIQGLIKQFAQALGLNGSEYARAFPTGQQTYTIKPSWQQIPSFNFFQPRALHLYFFYLLLVVVSISGLSLSFFAAQRPSEENEEQGTVQEQTVEEVETNDPQLATTDPSPDETEASQDSPQESSVTINVSIEADSWIRVTGDGEEIYEGVLSSGENRNWTAKEEITIRTGNAGGVIVEYNEESPAALGNSGEVTEVTYSPSQ
ncbi:helix-turn-helix domain-containing protein [Euhalothece natronophila Z-M001]|uniref:Helix-turn-helix domain-containing protein n=1 Tax=Euhalothece natronophila Z-M001 TaxID=522448 RepID=A0A5B8NNK2_9CHRO|nr:RodZ domain-containing protein [Euhalothece natronophila]QDZ39749.1 helix-turn-helix domain-containing protein [Euhalothece natronophila Z-M001]